MKTHQLTRKQYQKIKKYDHNEMNKFTTSLYQNGYEDGKKSIEATKEDTFTLQEIQKALKSTKGIGPKKQADILLELGKTNKDWGLRD